MTTAICLSVLLCGAVLSSCGGGIGSVKENKFFGKVPGIYVNLAKAYDQLGEDLKAAGTDSDKRKSLKEDYQNLVVEGGLMATEEGQALIGRDIPFVSGDIYPDYKVTAVRVGDFHQSEGTGSIVLRVMTEAKHDFVVNEKVVIGKPDPLSLREARIYYALLKSDDHLIELGQTNPFNSRPTVGNFKPETVYKAGDTVSAGSPCNPDGAMITINCHSYDFTDFAKIVFLAEKDYKAMRQQAYGF